MSSAAGRVLVVGVIGLASVLTAEAQTRSFEDTVPLESGSRLELETGRGSVHLIAWDEPRAEIVARIEAPTGVDLDTARRAVEATTIEVRGNRRSVRIRTRHDDARSDRSPDVHSSVHYVVRAPRQLDLELVVDRGPTTVDGFEGALLLQLDRSPLVARQLQGTLTVDADRGTVDLADVSGSLALSVDRAGHARLERVRGSLDVDLDRTTAEVLDLSLDADSVLRIDRGTLDVRLSSAASVTLQVEATRRSTVEDGPSIALDATASGRRGDVNGGGPTLRIEADRSTVRLGSE